MPEKVSLCLTLPSLWPCAPNIPRKIRELSPLEERTQICDVEHGQPGPPSSVPCSAGGFSGSAPPTLGARCPQPSSAGLRERVLTE